MNSQRRPSRDYVTVAFVLGMLCLAGVAASAQDVRLAPRNVRRSLPAPTNPAPGGDVGIIVIGGSPITASSPVRAQRRRLFTMQLEAENRIAQQARGAAMTSTAAAVATPSRHALPSAAGTSRSAADNRESPRATLDAMPEGIWFVNMKERDFLVTPGGYLTISGKGFGDALGQVNLIGDVPGGALPLRVVEWRDGEVYALVPKDTRGIADQAATVQVITRANRTYRREGARFVAAREEMEITRDIARVIRIQVSGDWPATVDAMASVVRTEQVSGNCRAPGTDLISFPKLPNGFEVIGVSIVELAPGANSGPLKHAGTFAPGYSFGAWTTQLPVSYGVWRFEPRAFQDASVSCESGYRISAVALSGPAGLTPW